MRYLFYIMFLTLPMCTTSKKGMKPAEQIPQVLTVILEATATEEGTVLFGVTNIIKAKGHVKSRKIGNSNYAFRFIDKDSNILEEQLKQIDLVQEIEYVKEDGSFAKKRIEGEPVVVVIRTNYQPEMTALQIFKRSNLKTPIKVITLNKINK